MCQNRQSHNISGRNDENGVIIVSTVLRIENVSKSYPGVKALSNVSMSFEAGEVHSIMGENGAGKSTLIKVISGAIKPDDGVIEIQGERNSSLTPALARKLGVGVIYQEFNQIPTLSVAENIFLGTPIGKSKLGPDFALMHKKCEEVFQRFNIDIDTHVMAGDISTAKQQIVEIAKAVVQDAKVLIMDEPTAAISMAEAEVLFDLIRTLKSQGITIIYVSHRLDEVFDLSDRVSILRDGQYIDTYKINEISRQQVINSMVGREVTESYPERPPHGEEVVLKASRLTGNGVFDISFELKKGEIFGWGGLVGAGRTELAKLIYGAARVLEGELEVMGRKTTVQDPYHAIQLGIGLIPENRKTEGVFQEFPIDWNISIMDIRNLCNKIFVSKKKVDELAAYYGDTLRIKTPSYEQLVKNLSGGNQQKVVLAKVLATDCKIIIFDEPTRGIDVGAKQEIYNLMNELTASGISIIMISSDMEELIGMSDRVMVLHEGHKMGEVTGNEINQNNIMRLASGLLLEEEV